MKQVKFVVLVVCRLSLVSGACAFILLFATQTRLASAASPSFVRIIHASPFVGTADVFVDGAKLLSSFPFGQVTDYATIPPGPHKVQIALVGKGAGASALTQTLSVTFDVSSPANNATLSTSTALNANMVGSLFVVGMFNGSPKSELVTAQTAGLPGVPNTGSDPNAVSQADAQHGQPLIPWLWPLGIASLLLIGSGFFMRRVRTKRGAGSQ